MNRLTPLFAALLLSIIGASPAEACWPWCKRGAPSGQTQEVELTVASGSRSPPVRIDTMQTWGVTQVEARTLFEIAYGGRKFTQGIEESYQTWLYDIGHAKAHPFDPYSSYEVHDRNSDIALIAGLYTRWGYTDPRLGAMQPGTMSLVTRGSELSAGTRGVRLGVDFDGYAGMLARALVALGGAAQITEAYRFLDLQMTKSQYVSWRRTLDSLEANARQQALYETTSQIVESKLLSDFLDFEPVNFELYDREIRVIYRAAANPRTRVMSEFVSRGVPQPLQALSEMHDQVGPSLQLAVQPQFQDTIGMDLHESDSESSNGGSDDEKELIAPQTREHPHDEDQDKNPLLK